VAILARGRLITQGRLSEMLAFKARGWELVMAGVDEAAVSALGSRVPRSVRIGEDRYAFELPLDPPPERLVAELTARGARLVSLNPVRETLEDFFVEQVSAPEAAAPRHVS
jgi:hypothetical protein